jgi:hypothetical protein
LSKFEKNFFYKIEPQLDANANANASANEHMIVSINYQHLYDFNREWKDMALGIDLSDNYDAVLQVGYAQSGSLYALVWLIACRFPSNSHLFCFFKQDEQE